MPSRTNDWVGVEMSNRLGSVGAGKDTCFSNFVFIHVWFIQMNKIILKSEDK